jgi:hypothetical protein
MRDVFKQGLVDLIAPKMAQHDRLLVERIRKLFPEFQLDFLLEEFAFLPSNLRIIQFSQRENAMNDLKF